MTTGNGAGGPVHPSSARPRVLIADDEPGFRKLVTYELSPAFEVVPAADGLEAVAKVKGGGIDVVITDIMMPNMDGLEATRAIKEYDPGIEVIVITGNAGPDTEEEAMRLGACNFLNKPFNLAELSGHVAGALRRRRERRGK